ncbi:hypothetical protein SHIRM173S_04579 [Streptomyces hirsutus]
MGRQGTTVAERSTTAVDVADNSDDQSLTAQADQSTADGVAKNQEQETDSDAAQENTETGIDGSGKMPPLELHSGHKLARRYRLEECVTRLDGFQQLACRGREAPPCRRRAHPARGSLACPLRPGLGPFLRPAERPALRSGPGRRRGGRRRLRRPRMAPRRDRVDRPAAGRPGGGVRRLPDGQSDFLRHGRGPPRGPRPSASEPQRRTAHFDRSVAHPRPRRERGTAGCQLRHTAAHRHRVHRCPPLRRSHPALALRERRLRSVRGDPRTSV